MGSKVRERPTVAPPCRTVSCRDEQQRDIEERLQWARAHTRASSPTFASPSTQTRGMAAKDIIKGDRLHRSKAHARASSPTFASSSNQTRGMEVKDIIQLGAAWVEIMVWVIVRVWVW